MDTLRLEILTERKNFEKSEEELKEKEKIYVFYTFDTQNHSLDLILRLREEVLKEYPDTADSDVRVYELTKADTSLYRSRTTLVVPIPVADYIKLRNAGEIRLL